MSYVKPNTFVSGNPINADQVDENNQALRKYLNNQIVTADIDTETFGPEHLVKGTYNPLQNQYQMISGLVGGKNYLLAQREVTGICHSPSGLGVPEDPTYVWLSNGGITFYLEEEADVLFQWYGQPYTTPLDSSRFRAARFYIAFDDQQWYTTRQKTWNEVKLPYKTRNYCSSFHVMKSVPAGYHTFSIKGYTTEAYSIFLAWGFTLEAFYKLPASSENPPDIPDDPVDPTPAG